MNKDGQDGSEDAADENEDPDGMPPDWLRRMMAREAALLGGVAEALRAAAAHSEAANIDPAKLAEIQARNLAAFEQATTTTGRQAIELFRAGLQRMRGELGTASTEADMPPSEPETAPDAPPPQRYATNVAQELSEDLHALRRETLLASLRGASRRLSDLAAESKAPPPEAPEAHTQDSVTQNSDAQNTAPQDPANGDPHDR